MKWIDIYKIKDEARFHEKMTNNFLPVNYWVIKIVGLNAAVMLSAIYNKYIYAKANQQISKNGYFNCSVAGIKEICGLSPSQQKTALQKLCKYKFVNCVTNGFPKKRFITMFFSSYHMLDYEADIWADRKEQRKFERIKKHNEIMEKTNSWYAKILGDERSKVEEEECKNPPTIDFEESQTSSAKSVC